jgi:TIR domain
MSKYLEGHGVRKWIAPGSIDVGVRWDVAITEAIVDSTAIVVLMSPHSAKSRIVQQELLIAKREAISLFPILFADDPFEPVGRHQFFDARHGGHLTGKKYRIRSSEPGLLGRMRWFC